MSFAFEETPHIRLITRSYLQPNIENKKKKWFIAVGGGCHKVGGEGGWLRTRPRTEFL